MFRQVREQVGDVNILVNNAGIMVKSLKLCFHFFVFLKGDQAAVAAFRF